MRNKPTYGAKGKQGTNYEGREKRMRREGSSSGPRESAVRNEKENRQSAVTGGAKTNAGQIKKVMNISTRGGQWNIEAEVSRLPSSRNPQGQGK